MAKGARGDFARAKMQINHRNRGLGPSKQANTATLQHVSECDLPGPHMHETQMHILKEAQRLGKVCDMQTASFIKAGNGWKWDVL